MRCTKCDRQNQSDATFCDRCGNRLAASCASCGSELRQDSHFCPSCGTSVDAQPQVDGATAVRTIGLGRYEIGEPLGEGGMKRVFQARDNRLDREVAVSLIRTDGITADDMKRIDREARAMAKLGDHPHVVGVYDIGEEDGQPYIVSQLMTGGDVAAMLKDSVGSGLPLAQVAAIADHVCQALTHAHSHGIVHRDIKPSNVWLTPDGNALLGDFGLAVTLDRTRITQAGMMMGTIAYMPPELATDGSHAAEPRSDLYSLGVMLYEMATGRLPFEGVSPESLLYQHVSATPVPPSAINSSILKAFDALALRLLEKSVSDRPASASDVREALALLVAASSDSATSGAAASAAAATNRSSDSLLTSAHSVFVGRLDEVAQLHAAYEDAAAGRGRLLMLVGEPGIGKTRLTEEAATYAGLRGGRVVAGSCFEGDVAPAYWPWVQVVRQYLAGTSPDQARAALGQGAGEIAQIVSEIRELIPDLKPPPELEPDEMRFRLFDAMASFIARASSEHPLVIILDDLHWSDTPSLMLLEFVVRQVRSSNVLLIATYRDVEIGRGHALSASLGVVLRESHVSRVVLRGLDEATVADFLERTAGRPVPATLTQAVFRETEGNPFFVNETARLLIDEGRIDDKSLKSGAWDLAVPQSVREVIGRRLDRLSGELNELLTLASVIGREFEVEVLAHVSDRTADEIVDSLEEGVKAQVIEEDRGGPSTFRFSHALIKETLLDEPTTIRRIRIHGRVADAIYEIHQAKLEPYLAELAYHACEASTGRCDTAIDYSIRAAELAMSQVAWEEAVELLARAREVLEQSETGDPALGCALLLALADAKSRVGEVETAVELYREAGERARAEGLPHEFALAAIAASETAAMQTIGEKPWLTDMLVEAEELLRGRDDSLLARVLSRRAVTDLYRSRDDEVERALRLVEIRALADEAMQIAEASGDPNTRLRTALDHFHLASGPDERDAQLALGREIVDLAVELQDREAEAEGRMAMLICHAAMYNRAGFDAELSRYAELAIEMRRPRYQMYILSRSSAVAMIEGRFDEARRLSDEALKIGTDAQEGEIGPLHMGQQFILGWLDGRLDRIGEIIEFFKIIEAQVGGLYGINGVIAFMEVLDGRLDEARVRFDRLSAIDFAVPKDIGWMASMCAMVWACEAVGTPDEARKIYDLMAPYRGQMIFIGGVTTMLGSTELYLGILACQFGDFALAVEHFAAAEAADSSFGATAYATLERAWRAEALSMRGETGDVETARALARSAIDEMDALGITRFRERVAAVLAGEQTS